MMNSSWCDRIPFVLLFSIATSIDLYEEKFSQSTTKTLRGTRFDLTQVDVDILFKVTAKYAHPHSLLLGPSISSLILQRHKDYVQSSSNLIQTLKVDL